MSELREQTGEGTLYDTENREVASEIAYRIAPGPTVGENETTWGGQIFFAHEDEEIGEGLYVLALEDGTRVNIGVNPRSAADGDPRTVAFRGVGTFGARIV